MSDRSQILHLDADAVLTTTRAVRRRLDLDRGVPRELVAECVAVAVQAPSGGDRHPYRFVVVDDAERRQALAEIYRESFAAYLGRPNAVTEPRLLASVRHLAEHLHRVPVLVVPCMPGRPEARTTSREQSGYWGSVYPAVWSFMLAARLRGLGTALTTMHLQYEREAAAVLDIPYDEVAQVCLLPLAYTVGHDFRRAKRDAGAFLLWNGWRR